MIKICSSICMMILLSSCAPTLNKKNNFVSEGNKEHVVKMLNVALMLPISGEHSAVGKSMQKASEMAVSEMNADQINLSVIDTGSKNERLDSLHQELSKKKFDIILGPVFANHAKVVYQYSSQKHIPMISFSNDVNLLGKKGLYLISSMPEQEIRRIVSYAINNGYEDIYAILPNNRYGDLIKLEMSNFSSASDNIVSVLQYQPDIAGINSAITQVKQELQSRSENGRKPAILIPEGNRIAIEVMKDLVAWSKLNNIKVKFLGSSHWDDSAFLSNEVTQDAFVVSVPNTSLNKFEDRFFKAYGYKPYKISAFAYDSIALAYKLSKQDKLNSDSVESSNGFVGVSGVFRFLSDGSNERLFSIYHVVNNSLTEIDSAPKGYDELYKKSEQ